MRHASWRIDPENPTKLVLECKACAIAQEYVDLVVRKQTRGLTDLGWNRLRALHEMFDEDELRLEALRHARHRAVLLS